MKRNPRGQALIELFIALPVFTLMAAGLLLILYFLLATYWADHWVYRANMCLIEGNSQCQIQFEQKIRILLPEDSYHIQDFRINSRESLVSLQFHLLDVDLYFSQFKFKKDIQSRIHLPLRSDLSPTTMGFP